MKLLNAVDGTSIYLKAIIGNLIVQIVAGIFMKIVSYAMAIPTEDIPVALNLFISLLFQLMYGLVFFLYVIKPKKVMQYEFRKKPPLLACLLAPVITLIALAAFMGMGVYFSLFLQTIGYGLSSAVILKTPLDFILGIIVMVIAAPIFEELIFRGALLSGLKARFGTLTAVIMSGAAFSLMHMNPEQTVYQFFLGATCAYVVISCKSVIPAMIIHACNNLFALLIDYTAVGSFVDFIANSIASNLFSAIFVPIALCAVGIVAILFIGKLLASRSPLIAYPLDNNGEIRDMAADGYSTEALNAPAPKRVELSQMSLSETLDYGVLGKRTAMICYTAAMVISGFMWIMLLVIGIFPI